MTRSSRIALIVVASLIASGTAAPQTSGITLRGVYNFQGLRAFKQKFDPEWTPKYLAYPGGLRLPVILADLAALVAGGYRRILASPPALLKRP